MLVSHRKRFIYIKAIKTAGTSTELYFEKYCMPEGAWEFSHGRNTHISDAGIICRRGRKYLPGKRFVDPPPKVWKRSHIPAKIIQMNLEPHIWNSYFKFCNIRNPFDALISLFYFHRGRGLRSRSKRWLQYAMRGKFRTRIRHIAEFKNFVKNLSGSLPVMNMKNIFMINNEVAVDYFIRYEDLKGGIKHVCKILNIPFEPDRILRLKSGFRDTSIPIKDFYDDETIAIVQKHFPFVLRKFGYSLEGPY